MEITRWHLVRHAPVSENVICGWRDSHADLSDAAALQAVSAQLPDAAGLLTSDLIRSMETAAALSDHHEYWYAMGRDPDWREQSFGDWEGMTYGDAAAQYPEESRAFWRDPALTPPPRGESFSQVCARVGDALRRYRSENIVCVCHAGAIRAALAMALGVKAINALAFEIAPLSVTVMDRIETNDGDAWRICCVNRVYGQPL